MALVAILVVFAAGVLALQRRVGMQRIDGALDATAAQLTNMLREELRELDAPKLAAEESASVIASPGNAMAILDRDGGVLSARLGALSLTDLVAGGVPASGYTDRRDRAWRVARARRSPDARRRRRVFRRRQPAERSGARSARAAASDGARHSNRAAARRRRRPVDRLDRAAAGDGDGAARRRDPADRRSDLGPPLRDDELGQLTRAFNGLVGRLRAALQTQRQFMADASHELRSPVSVIRTAADVALSRRSRDESEYREALTIAGAQSRRLGTLVEDMLVLARADAGGYPFRPIDFYLDDAIDECRRAVGLIAADRHVALHVTGASDVPVRADTELLRRLVVNLLQNAVQHTPPGGAVAIDVAVNGAEVGIRVTDGGAGIADEDRARIFDRFVQLDPSRRGEGAGLGLTIAKWIAERHGGSLTIESSGPCGTTFRVLLPVLAAVSQAELAASS